MKTEIIFLGEESPEGGFTARALGESIFTEVDTWDALKTAIQDPVNVHFEGDDKPSVIRLHLVRQEVLTL